MSHGTKTDDGTGSTLNSVLRSVLTHYWPFTIYVMAYTTAGMALGAIDGTWNWTVYAVAMATIWAGLEGLHAIDLADEGLTLDIDSGIQKKLGYLEVAVGGVLGVLLAYMTTWWFLAFVAVGTFLGIAYNEEWFGGLLHDFDTTSGLLNFGISWGALPAVGGYFLISGTVSLGMLVFSVGVMLDAFRLITLFEASKPAPYEDRGIVHNRTFDPDTEWLTETTHKSNQFNMAAWVFIAAGLVLLFVV